MPDPVCFYDDPYDYDSDVFWNGACPPEPIPVETPFVFKGRPRRQPKKKFYCFLEIDTLYCYVNGEVVEKEKLNNQSVRHTSEEDEDEKPLVVVNNIGVKKRNEDQYEWVVNSATIEESARPEIVVQDLSLEKKENTPEVSAQVSSLKTKSGIGVEF